MYDSIDIKYINLPDVHKLENHEDYVTFSHADMLSKEGIFYDSSRDTELLQTFVSHVSKGFRHAYRFATSVVPERKRRVYVYDPSCLYPMGWVGYGDFSIHSNQGSKYTVCSLHIKNNRFDYDKEQHRMLIAQSMAVAIKNAHKYLQPVTHRDVLISTFSLTEAKVASLGINITRRASRKVAQSGIELSELANASQPQVWVELCYLLDSEHTFLSSEFRDTIVAARDNLQELADNKAKVVNLYCVRVYEREGKQFYDIIPVDDITRVDSSAKANRVRQALRDHKPIRCDNDTIPEDIYSKLSVLAVCDKGEFVEDVGHRNQDTVYYVYA
jgi:hypothetical protein|tara:strand:+ start:978 stop:1964 length:987 start_codon:yes stop_codon:yes gene_type:complete